MSVFATVLREFNFSCLIVQQRLRFPVFGRHTVATEGKLLAEVRWHGNSKSESEQNPHDDECEDPLEGDCLDEELVYCQGYTSASAVSHGAIR